jgi:hypothetical protein
LRNTQRGRSMATFIVTFTRFYSSSAGCSRGREEARRRLCARGQVARLVLIERAFEKISSGE